MLKHPLAPWLALLLAACGGGDPAPPSGTPAPPASTPPPAQTTCGISGFDTQVLQLVNQHRAAGASCGSAGSFPPAPALAWHSQLAAAAYTHSLDMATNNYFSHTGLDGRSVAQRTSAAGYDWRAVGENIAGGPSTVAATVAGWMASPGHCANIMNATYVHVGMACASSAGSTYGRYWTMVLAAPR